MESLWSSFLVVAVVFAAFSGSASAWGVWQRRKRAQQQALWQALLQPGTEAQETAAHPPGLATHPPDLATPSLAEARPRRARSLPPDPSFADCPSFLSDSDSRRAALDEALDRMSRQPPADASHSTDWEDTEPSVSVSRVLAHGAGQRSTAP